MPENWVAKWKAVILGDAKQPHGENKQRLKSGETEENLYNNGGVLGQNNQGKEIPNPPLDRAATCDK